MTRRDTSQQRAIRSAIEDAGRPLSIREIAEIAEGTSPGIGIRTIYRVIKRLLEDQVIKTVTMAGHADRYEPTAIAETHHHHFHCERCDRVFDVPGCAGRLDRMIPPGFQLKSHELTLNGLCDACAG